VKEKCIVVVLINVYNDFRLSIIDLTVLIIYKDEVLIYYLSTKIFFINQIINLYLKILF
jgi:hypothetical protein